MDGNNEGLIESLFEIFDFVWNGPHGDVIKKQFDKFAEHSNRTIENLTALSGVISELKSGTKKHSLMHLFFYLVSIEGGFVNHADFVCLLLVLQGHDLYNFYRRQYVTTDLETIKEVDLYTKIQFLEEHGLDSFTNICDRKLRNSIAHHDFSIDENGRVFVDNEGIDIEKKNEQLISFLNLTKDVIIGSRIAQRKTTKGEKLGELERILTQRKRI